MFKCSDWYRLLEAQPQFSIYCDKYRGWSLLSDDYWMCLLNKHSQFIEKYRDTTKSEETDDEILNKDELRCFFEPVIPLIIKVIIIYAILTIIITILGTIIIALRISMNHTMAKVWV